MKFMLQSGRRWRRHWSPLKPNRSKTGGKNTIRTRCSDSQVKRVYLNASNGCTYVTSCGSKQSSADVEQQTN